MAIYYCKIHSVKRSSGGNSAVKKAAYNSGDELHDNEQDKTFKFDKPEVIESKIVLPQNAAERFKDRATLWNAAQKAEKSVTGNLAREFVIAIPRELNQDQAINLIDDFARSLARQGMCIDYAIHWKENNPHAHLLATTRLLDKNGEFAPIKEKKVLARDKDGNKIPLLDENGKVVRVVEKYSREIPSIIGEKIEEQSILLSWMHFMMKYMVRVEEIK